MSPCVSKAATRSGQVEKLSASNAPSILEWLHRIDEDFRQVCGRQIAGLADIGLSHDRGGTTSAGYLREAEQMRRSRALLADDPRFSLPEPVEELLHQTVLPMDFLAGAPIETLATASETVRNGAMDAMLDLVLRELFEFGLMQTDPNFANYRWQRDNGRIVLLDFGAARSVAPESVEYYRSLLRAGLTGDIAAVRNALIAMGFASTAQASRHGSAIDAIIGIGLQHLHSSRSGLFDFADRQFVSTIRHQAAPLIADRASWRPPPPDKLFLQRKVSGMALLFTRLQARMPPLEKLIPYA